MTQFGVINLGRFPLVEFPTQPATDASSAPSAATSTGRTLKLQGQESVPAAREIGTTTAMLEAWRADMAGLVNSFVAATFTDKSGLNGYYVITDTSADLQNWENEQQTLSWSINLNRVGTDFEVDIESRLTGTTRANMFGLTGVRWHSPSIGHYSYFSAPGNTPSVVTRTGSDGAHVVYLNLPSTQTTIPRWGCPVNSYMNGRTFFLDPNGVERSGILFASSSVLGWTLGNGLVQITPSAGPGVLNLFTYNLAPSAGAAAAFSPAKVWDIQFNGTSIGVPQGVSLLRNEPEIVVLRMVFTYQSVTRITCDLTLRRGARHVEIYLQSQVSGQFKIVRTVAESATSASGYIQAAADDVSGEMYLLGSALSTTADLVNGGISSSASVVYMDALLGAQSGQAVLNANPYFETSVSPWAATNGTIAQSSAHAHQGTWSMLLTPTGGNSQAYAQSELEPVVAGNSYDATGWVWPTSAMSGNIGVGINWFNSSSASLSVSSNLTATVTSGSWNFLVLGRNITAPASAAFAALRVIESGTPPAGATAWWDEVKLRASVPAGDAVADLYNQYIATPSELVQGIRR